MKNVSLIWGLLATVAVLVTVNPATADQPAASTDIDKLNTAISQINEQAKMPQAESLVVKQLEQTFDVSGRKIHALRRENTQYGDVAAALAVAERLPGGITNPNLNEVTQGKNKTTWDQVARHYKIDIGSLADRLNSVQQNIQTALAESARGSAAGGTSQPGQ